MNICARISGIYQNISNQRLPSTFAFMTLSPLFCWEIFLTHFAYITDVKIRVYETTGVSVRKHVTLCAQKLKMQAGRSRCAREIEGHFQTYSRLPTFH
jgi:hypothetical protein